MPLCILVYEYATIFYMKSAYAFFGILLVLIIIGAAYSFSRKTGAPDTSDIINTTESMATALSITSSAFENDGRIPSKFTCDGDKSLSPQLSFSGVPSGTKSLTLVMDDPDVPKQLRPDGVFDHWTLFNIPPETTGIPEGISAGTSGVNGAGKNAYTGPCPPTQYEPSEHRYIFALYALDTMLSLPEGVTKQEVLQAIDGHILAEARLIGRYSRK